MHVRHPVAGFLLGFFANTFFSIICFKQAGASLNEHSGEAINKSRKAKLPG